MTALAGALYCQYQMFISPDTVSGIAVSLQMVFAVVVGGIYVALGPTVGAVITHPAGRGPAHLLRHQGGRLGQPGLRRAAGAVHHLPAQGHPGQPPRPPEGQAGDDGAGAQARLGATERGDAERRRAAAHGERRQGFGDECRTAASSWPANRPRPARRGRPPWRPRAAAPRRSACRRHRRSRRGRRRSGRRRSRRNAWRRGTRARRRTAGDTVRCWRR